ncbi:hypothetical protein TWF281_010868 [Arthrobotrys megalospora]
MDPLSTAASIIAIIQALGSCWKIYSSIKDAKSDIDELQKEVASVEELVKRVEELISGSNNTELSTSRELEVALEGCRTELERLKEKLGPEKKPKFFGLVKARDKWPLTGPDALKIVENLERWKQSINLALSIDHTVQLRSVNRKLDFAGLPFAEGAAYGSFQDQHEPECFPDTRVNLLKDIEGWVKDPQGKCLFWLNGVAGTGKSTISRTIAKGLVEGGQLAASFFFKRGERDRGDASKFFTTLASQLANHIRDIAPSIQKAIDMDTRIANAGHREQFDKLIFQPLSQPRHPSSQTIKAVLVIDALDECDREADQQLIVSLLARLGEIKSVEMRVFLTSRPETPLRLGFKELSGDTYRDMILHEIPGIKEDIALFLRAEFAEIRKSNTLPSDWPGDESIQKLAEMAVPLFIFAATACRFISDGDPEDQIEIVMGYQSGWHVSQLERTYLPVLHSLMRNAVSQEKLLVDFRQIVGTIVNLASPLSIPALSRLLSTSERTISHRLRPLHSVLDIPAQTTSHSPIRMFHLSFRDFLLDQHLRKNSEFCHFWVDETEAHRSIYNKCIEFMSGPEGLKKNICNLKSPGTLRSDIDKTLIQQYLPPELQYACRYWIYHLKQSTDRVNDNSQVHEFLRKHLLNWLEAFGLLGEMGEIVQIIDTLSSTMNTQSGKDISALVHDIKRFVRQNHNTLDIAPLQAHWSVLIFAPKRSIIRTIFNPEETILEVTEQPRVQDQWDALLQILEGHTGTVQAIAFSTNGMLASASGDHTIKIWNAATGALLQTLEGHTGWVQGLAFSTGDLLASASDDETIGIWNTGAGVLSRKLGGHAGWVVAVAFSADGVLASASHDNTVKVWDPAAGVLLRTLEGHTDTVRAVAFSTDGVLASASTDKTIKIWDPASGVLLRTLEGHASGVCAVAFSPDNLLASASADKTIKLWDVASGALRQTLEGHLGKVNAVAFSTDGMLASAGDRTVRTWNVASGTLTQILEGHTNEVGAVAFSIDGKVVASGSNDGTVRIWDVATKGILGATKTPWAPPQTLETHAGSVCVVKFSRDGEVLASGSSDGAVQIWNVATRAPIHILKGHMYQVGGLAFSIDGEVLASGSLDSTIKIWHITTGTLLRNLKGHNGWVQSVAFSADGELLASGSLGTASGSYDYTIIIWDRATGALLQTFRTRDFPTGIPRSLSFSEDGQCLVVDGASFAFKDGYLSRSAASRTNPHQNQHKQSIVVANEEWVVRNGERILWLPHNYRAKCSDAYGDTIALGHRSGGVSFFKFKG